jgi:hypothetical protein
MTIGRRLRRAWFALGRATGWRPQRVLAAIATVIGGGVRRG